MIKFRVLVNWLLEHKTGHLLSDKTYICLRYWAIMGKKLDLRNPITYNEKIQWLKLYDHDPLYTILVDKASVKKYVEETIGSEYVIPTLAIWDKPEDINWESLPDQFVLKVTHDSGGLIICKDKKNLDIENTKIKISKSLRRNYYMLHREWPYRDVPRRIIAEKYMEDTITGDLRDYKFFVFNGNCKALFIASDRQNKAEETKFDFFDAQYNRLPLRNGHPNSTVIPSKPVCFDKMKELAEKLGQGIPHVRVDFYEVNGKVYFGEMTFFHWSGLMPFDPEEWDYTFGSWIKLPNKKG